MCAMLGTAHDLVMGTVNRLAQRGYGPIRVEP
jgi:hypothetical protein